MTVVVASKPLFTADLDLLDFTAGAVTTASATTYRITHGTSYDELTGTFAYDGDGRLLGGSITGWKRVTDGGVAFTATGASRSVDDFLAILAAGNPSAHTEFFFTGDDKITGSNFGDVVLGFGGNDSIAGRGGDDFLDGGADNDTLDGGAANDALLGGSGNDSLLGGAGDDFLDGGPGADTLAGGAGNDVYSIVDAIGDAIVETAGQGIDAVVTNVASFSLVALPNVEDLRLTAPGSTGTGNALNNHIRAESGDQIMIGGDGNDTLDGGAGADSLIGGKGDDTYIIGDAGDKVAENPNEGADTIRTSLGSFSLNSSDLANVENLILLTGAKDGTGNDLANVITGNDADNDLRGFDGSDTLVGGSGKDSLRGGDGPDLLTGGDGDDIYVVDNSGDKIVEGAGPNSGFDSVAASVSYTLAANLEELVLVNTMGAGPSTGTGNAGNNNIFGNDNTNKLLGLGGNDSMDGGDGDDIVDGGIGLDDIKGGAGADTLLGGIGDDILDGGLGADSMAGGAGNDFYTLDDAGDLVSELPGQGTDAIFSTFDTKLGANFENLFLLGGARSGLGNELNNRIDGTGGNDTLSGGLGNDTLDGGVGADSLIGGKGNDTYLIDNAGDAVSENPGEGTDTVRSSLATTDLGAAAFANVENLTLLEGAFDGTGNGLANVITGNDEVNFLDGAAGNDTMIGGKGDDLYFVDAAGDKVVELAGAGSGFDVIIASVSYTLAANVEQLNLNGAGKIDGTGNAADNVISDVSAGDNKLFGLQGNDFLFGGNGNDTLDGGAGNDTLSSGSGSNLLSGGAGNDTLFGNGVDDTLAGGAGNDLYRIDSFGTTVVEAAGQGIDTIQTTLLDVSLDTKALANVENLKLTSGSSSKGTGNALNNAITGDAANDTLIGGLGDDTLDGGGAVVGDDSLVGGKGNDVYIINGPFNILVENPGEGSDTVLSSLSSTDFLAAGFANIENLTLIGSALNGRGNELANVITGNDNANVLGGDVGNDTLIGGKGNDTYQVDSAADKVVELAGVDTGFDVVSATVDYVLSANVERLNLLGAVINGAGNASDNFIVANAAANKLAGAAGNDNLFGEDGNDTLDGGLGNDTLFGDRDDDQLLGGAGDDLLNGGIGKDTLGGGAGNDTYLIDDDIDVVVEAAGQGSDRVIATVDYKLGSSLENLSLESGVTLGQGNELNNHIADIGLFQTNNRLEGFAGNDTLDGGLGADTLVGGKGNDTYVVDNLNDTVTELGGEGTDIVRSSLVTTNLGMAAFANVENLVLLGGALNGAGNGLANVITGNDKDNELLGGGGSDTLIGGAGADTLIGSPGDLVVLLVGGSGSDTYTVQSLHTTIVEAAGKDSGIDTVIVDGPMTQYTLAANVENLVVFSGTDGIGNASDNLITGDTGGNKLLGMAGNDGLTGDAGDDTLDGGAGNDLLLGGDGNDKLLGGANDDVLDGGTGVDTLAGGAGNDRYIIDSATDQITEVAGQGLDSVIVEAGTYTLAANVENADLFNNAGAVGNALGNLIAGDTIFSGNNAMSGGGGNDTLVGGTGSDVMNGGAGRDTFVIAEIDAFGEAVTDFDAGPLGDALDLSDLLVGFVPGSSNANDFVRFVDGGGSTIVQVDADGAANGASFVDVCVLLGVTLTNVNQAAMEGNLVLA